MAAGIQRAEDPVKKARPLPAPAQDLHTLGLQAMELKGPGLELGLHVVATCNHKFRCDHPVANIATGLDGERIGNFSIEVRYQIP